MRIVKLGEFWVNADEVAIWREAPKKPDKTLVWFRGGAMEGGDWEFTVTPEAFTKLMAEPTGGES